MSAIELEAVSVWSGSHRGVRFEIKHRIVRGLESLWPSGSWTFYIYLHEQSCPRFAELWLDDQVTQITPESQRRVTHDYMGGLTGQVELHGGITYYSKHGHTPGLRCVELGCDYQHLYDEGQSYDERDLARDAVRAIESCYELGIVKEEQP